MNGKQNNQRTNGWKVKAFKEEITLLKKLLKDNQEARVNFEKIYGRTSCLGDATAMMQIFNENIEYYERRIKIVEKELGKLSGVKTAKPMEKKKPKTASVAADSSVVPVVSEVKTEDVLSSDLSDGKDLPCSDVKVDAVVDWEAEPTADLTLENGALIITCLREKFSIKESVKGNTTFLNIIVMRDGKKINSYSLVRYNAKEMWVIQGVNSRVTYPVGFNGLRDSVNGGNTTVSLSDVSVSNIINIANDFESGKLVLKKPAAAPGSKKAKVQPKGEPSVQA